MLSHLRYALQSSARRALSTAAVSAEVKTLPHLSSHGTGSSIQAPGFGILPNGAKVATASTLVKPVYLSMSSLLPQAKDSPEADNVIELDPFIFNHPIRRDILHLCVVQYLDCLRQGTASTKTRGDVRGSGRKIRPQKGSGKARLGDGQSPMLRGGGVAFGPKPRDFSTKLPRKVIQMGMRVALSAKLQERGFGVVQSLEWQGNKTKDLAERLDELGWKKTLFVTGHEKVPELLKRASSNLYKIETTTVQELNVYDIIKWPRLVVDVNAVEWLESALAKQGPASPRIL